MALQLVYTSAPKLLDAGRSGFGVVARSKNLPPLAANAIERFSKYANMQGTNRSRIVMTHRKVTIGSSRLHVLSRIRDSGSDHTGRTNHIAHHLIISPLEIKQAVERRLTPADIFEQFAWLDKWEGAPKAFDSSADVHIGNFLPNYSAAGRAAWAAATGEPIHSRLLAWDGAPKSGALIVPNGIAMLPLIGEALVECQSPWEKTFTTSLEPTDELAELDWVVALKSDSTAISRISSRTVFDISRPLDLPVPTEAPLPKPDIRGAASQEGAAPVSHQRVLPPPDLTHRPLQVRTTSRGVGEGAPRGNREAVVASKGSGNGKLWLIIGGGVAALFLLIAAALFLVKKPSETDNNVQVAKKEKEMAILVDRLFKVSEPEANAEKIAARVGEIPVLNELPIYVQRLKEGFENLGKKDLSPEELSKELEDFINTTNDIQIRVVASEGSLSDLLLKSLQQIKELKGKDDGQKTDKSAGELLLALKKSLGRAAEFNKPEWLKKEGIDRIYLTLWELEYQNLVDNLLNGTNAVTVQEVDQFMDIRYANDVTLVPDSTIEEIHGRLGEDKLKKYAAKVNAENPKLLKKFLLPAPMAEDKDKIAATSPDKDDPKPGNNPPVEAPKLEDEEWCYANFKPEGNEFSVKVPGSAILRQISEAKDYQNVEFSFGDEEIIKVGASGNSRKTIKFENNQIIITRALDNIPIPSPLKIIDKGHRLVIHFGKWPDAKMNKFKLSGRFEQVPSKENGQASYRLYLDGHRLEELEEIRSKTIPDVSLEWAFGFKDKSYKGTILRGEKSFVIESLKPGVGEVESPPKEVSSAFKKALEMTKKAGETLQEENEEKNNLQKRSDDEVLADAWENHGFAHIKNVVPDALKWLKKRFKAEHGRELGSISRISGNDMDDNDALVLNILENPTGKQVDPELPINQKVSVGILYDNKKVYVEEFSIELGKKK